MSIGMRMDVVKWLVVVGCVVTIGGRAMAAEPVDSIGDRHLDEVVVKAENVIHRDGCQVLLLSKENREFGTNALDAISSMNRFVPSLNATTLTSWDRQNVYVLINGVPSTALDLRSYQGADIKKVEYYQVAPARYLSFTTGPIVNVITKRRFDRLYSAYVNARNAVNAGYGTDQLDLTYADSLNQVKIGYIADYRIYRGTELNSDYIYSPDMATSYVGRGRHHWVNQTASVSYQRFQGDHLFNAKLSFISDPANERYDTRSALVAGQDKLSGSSRNYLESDAKTGVADLYYAYTFPKGSLFAVNVVNTLGKSTSTSEVWMDIPSTDGGEPFGNIASVDNNVYNLSATAMFVSFIRGGQFSVANAYDFKRMSQSVADVRTTPHIHYDFFNAGYAKSFPRENASFSAALNLGGSIYSQATSEKSLTNISPYVRIYGDWWGQGKLSGLTAQLTMTLSRQTYKLGDLSGSPTYLDTWFVSTGNPSLKNDSWRTMAKLAVGYIGSSNPNRLILMVMPEYDHHPAVSVIAPHDGIERMRPTQISSSFTNYLELNGNWAVFPWLEISPYVELYTTRYDTPSRRVRSNYLRGGGSLKFSKNNFEAAAHVNSPTKEFDGDLTTESGMQWAITAQYKYRNFSFGFHFNYAGSHTTVTGKGVSAMPAVGEGATGLVPCDFSYSQRKSYHPREMFSLSFTCYFSKGRARNHDPKYLRAAPGDDGLTDQNSAKP